ncbi:GDSL-type esterase/lipase family protein [Salinifilum ghardaiensis]
MLALCGVLAVTVLTSDRYLPTVPEQPERLPPAVVTLGDSMVSGEGTGNYVPGTDGADGNWCHRSPAATVHQLPVPRGVTTINLACSGARAGAVGDSPRAEYPEESQSEQLAEIARRYRITDVVVQVGANDDPSFVETVNRCVEAWGRRDPAGCSGELRELWPQRVERMRPKVTSALRDVRAAMIEAGYTRSGYSLVVQSYPSPVGPGVPDSLQDLSGCPFLTPDLRWIRDRAVPQLNEALREVAERADARFLDLSRAGVGHEACTGDPRTGDGEWFTRLTIDWHGLEDERRAGHAMQESFHTNAAGHAQIARCLGQFLATREQQAECLPNERGDLRAVPADEAAGRHRP